MDGATLSLAYDLYNQKREAKQQAAYGLIASILEKHPDFAPEQAAKYVQALNPDAKIDTSRFAGLPTLPDPDLEKTRQIIRGKLAEGFGDVPASDLESYITTGTPPAGAHYTAPTVQAAQERMRGVLSQIAAKNPQIRGQFITNAANGMISGGGYTKEEAYRDAVAKADLLFGPAGAGGDVSAEMPGAAPEVAPSAFPMPQVPQVGLTMGLDPTGATQPTAQPPLQPTTRFTFSSTAPDGAPTQPPATGIPGVPSANPKALLGYQKTVLTEGGKDRRLGVTEAGKDRRQHFELSKQDEWHRLDWKHREQIARENIYSNEQIARIISQDKSLSREQQRAEFTQTMALRQDEFGYEKVRDAANLQERYFSDVNRGTAASGLSKNGLEVDQQTAYESAIKEKDDLNRQLTTHQYMTDPKSRKTYDTKGILQRIGVLDELIGHLGRLGQQNINKRKAQVPAIPFGNANLSVMNSGSVGASTGSANTGRFGNITSQPWYPAVKKVMNDAGISDFAWMHNVNRESGGNPNATGDHGHSHGIFQFNFAGGLGSTLVQKYGQAKAMQIAKDPVLAAQVMAQEARAAGVHTFTDPMQQAYEFTHRVERPAQYVQDQVRRELLGGGGGISSREVSTRGSRRKRQPLVMQAAASTATYHAPERPAPPAAPSRPMSPQAQRRNTRTAKRPTSNATTDVSF